jgi:hypothetical protein
MVYSLSSWVRDALLRLACSSNRSASMQRERSTIPIGLRDPVVINESPRRTHPCETSDLVSMLVARFCDPTLKTISDSQRGVYYESFTC